MRLLIISDIHGHLENILPLSQIVKKDSPSAILICGDITHFGTLSDAANILRAFTELGLTLYVPGNCDPPELAEQPILEEAVNLHAKCIPILGSFFIGVGGSIPTPFKTPFENGEEEVNQILESAVGQCPNTFPRLLVSHNPPYGTHADKTLIGQHVGSKSIRSFIDTNSPIIVACGHIHESRSSHTVGKTIVINPGPLHRGYYAIAEVGTEVSVVLKEI
jgi:Icc-related predicted phosphoesterase